MHLEAAAASIDYGDQALSALRAVEGHHAIWAILAGPGSLLVSYTQIIPRQQLPRLTFSWSCIIHFHAICNAQASTGEHSAMSVQAHRHPSISQTSWASVTLRNK